MDRLLCNVAEAEEATGLSRTTLYALMRDGELGFVKIGSRRLIPVDELQRFVDGLSDRQGFSSGIPEDRLR